jgi:general secretion pathway protein D
MKRVVMSLGLVSFLVAPMLLQAQTPAAVERESNRGVSLEQVIESVAKKTSKKFIIDPRVHGDVLVIGSSATNGDYAQLLSVLEVHGFAAVDSGGFVQVVPAASVRQLPVPTVTGNKRYADSEVVTKALTIKSIPAGQLVPMLRPLFPQAAHLAAFPCTNTLLMVDRYANVERIEAIVATMDKGEPFKPRDCSVEEPKK